jgi:hypothetical protein
LPRIKLEIRSQFWRSTLKSLAINFEKFGNQKLTISLKRMGLEQDFAVQDSSYSIEYLAEHQYNR